MEEFLLYMTLGREHILDWNGIDHVLFIIAISGLFSFIEWKKVVFLVTAFTLGHSVSLALASFEIISFPTEIIEFLIPLTILITALLNLFKKDVLNQQVKWSSYALTLFFGLIHGMGFSNYLKQLLGSGNNIVVQLFGFNLGLELGQLLIVLCVLGGSFIFTEIFSVNRRDWRLVLSSAIAGISLLLTVEAIYW
ncbi:HupE/UreJ family protein [Fulvivirga lutea]|uniref:HupE/UreJ family protein n=1 Tax=Fulvivirga lutea TaxID=2810512 RepID=A0A975A182_9BACT|nr:HupE/UreJ family protein [Fulvivirga lutea]QSE98169.1 HupE/UreJ family protein [Fulvivirga lutea]